MTRTPRSIHEIADKLAQAARENRSPRITPETALLLSLAARAFATNPARDDVARALCSTKGGCASLCMTCVGKANQIQRLSGGRD